MLLKQDKIVHLLFSAVDEYTSQQVGVFGIDS